jgi:hypothetical protein
MNRLLIATLGFALAACGTPQENCIRGVTRDLRVVDGLIGDTRANLARGYALEDYTTSRAVWKQCLRRTGGTTPDGRPAVAPGLCFENEPYTVTRPKAIDLSAEQRTLAGLISKRAQLVRQSERAVAQCRAQHPE